MNKAFNDKESKKALRAFETISEYCRSRNDKCLDCVFAAHLDGVCLFQDSVWMGDNFIGGITKSKIIERATELME